MSPPPMPDHSHGTPKAVRTGRIFVVVVIAITLAYGIFDAATQRHRERNEVHDAIAQVRDAALGTHDAAPTATPATTPMAQALLQTKGLIVALQARMKEHEAAIDALQVEDVLLPQNLVDIQRAKDGKRRVTTFAQINQQMRDEYTTYIHDTRQVVLTMPVNRDATLRAFETNSALQGATLQNALSLNGQVADIGGQILDLAIAQHDKFKFEKGELVVYGDAWDRYAALISQLKALIPRLELAGKQLASVQADLAKRLDDAEKATR